MAPLILHHVPEDEEFVGPDGIRRPYAVYDSNDANAAGVRPRRIVPETGSFGKSRQRSRSRTGTPAAKREDPTFAAADSIFSQFLADRSVGNSGDSQRKTSGSSAVAQSNHSSNAPLSQIDGNAGSSSRFPKTPHKEPTEVILRGFKSTQQYAAIREYERIAGRICENYDREPPPEQRRFKADVHDAAVMQQKALTAEEKVKANRFAGGDHWIKVTFESVEAAEIALESSPQNILGHLVYAESYRGVPPTLDEEIVLDGKARTMRAFGPGLSSGVHGRKASATLPRSFGTPAMREIGRGGSSLSPPDSSVSSNTIDSGTIASTTSTDTVTGAPVSMPMPEDDIFCKRIPTAKKIKLIDSSKALLPQPSLTTRLLSKVPLLSWVRADPIGNELPMTDQGEFDYKKASFYWRIMYLIQSYTGLPLCGDVFKED